MTEELIISKTEDFNIKTNKILTINKKENDRNLIDVSKISKEELNNLLDEGFRDIEEGKYQTVEEAFKNIYD